MTDASHIDDLLNEARKDIHHKRYREAISKCELLTSRGNNEAPDYLGILYGQGAGCTKDIEKAEVYFRTAHERGYVLGSYHLGCLIFRQDRFREAFRAFEAIADKNPSGAYWAYQSLLNSGADDIRNAGPPEKFLQLAATQGHIEARTILARRIARGGEGILRIPYGIHLLFKLRADAIKAINKGEKFKVIDTLSKVKTIRQEELDSFYSWAPSKKNRR